MTITICGVRPVAASRTPATGAPSVSIVNDNKTAQAGQLSRRAQLIVEPKRERPGLRSLYIALLVDSTLGLGVLSLLVCTRAGSSLYAVVDELPWWGRAFPFRILVPES